LPIKAVFSPFPSKTRIVFLFLLAANVVKKIDNQYITLKAAWQNA